MTTLLPGLTYAIATTMKVCIATGLVTIVMALAQRLAVLGLAMDAALIALFWHFEFYALGLDQDTWAPR